MGRRVGIFGGTFDPPHLGHLVMAAEVAHLRGLDRVEMMVAHDPWQKSADRLVTPGDVRFEMTRAAVAGSGRLFAGDAEIRRGGPTYTIDTVTRWRAEHPDDDVTLIVGADAAAGLDGWHRAGELASAVEIAVVRRSGFDSGNSAAPGGRWRTTLVESPLIDVSSTEIRRRCRDGTPIEYLVPTEVIELIEHHGLYREGR